MSDSKHVLIVYFAILLLIVVVLYGFASITPQEKTAFRCGTHSPHGYWLTEATTILLFDNPLIMIYIRI